VPRLTLPLTKETPGGPLLFPGGPAEQVSCLLHTAHELLPVRQKRGAPRAHEAGDRQRSLGNLSHPEGVLETEPRGSLPAGQRFASQPVPLTAHPW
jgi:hypothetical protein